MRFFKNVAKNVNDVWKDSQLYISQDSLVKKLKIHFGHKVDFFAHRFYAILSDNTSAKKIYFKDFIDKMYKTLFAEDIRG